MYFRGPAVGLTFCTLYLAFYFTNKYVLSILKFTFPTLFQGWQTLVGGVLLHICWKLGWVEINCSSRADIVSWLPASAFFVGIIYAGSRGLSRLPIPIFLTLHNASEVVTYLIQRIFYREQSSYIRLCSVALLLVSAGCLPIHDQQFDVDGYFWALIHLICSGCYKVFQKSHKSSLLSDLDQQYINYFFRTVCWLEHSQLKLFLRTPRSEASFESTFSAFEVFYFWPLLHILLATSSVPWNFLSSIFIHFTVAVVPVVFLVSC
ncbi:hypothetical protein GDO81_011516 [Engystomops pustulosus]|uniref:Transmembrane protein 241 n=1 Tax=Engystomops pustulosus TaxID=76066 RepID=A0AAV7BES4_ENGPU|nr:hypothetical protein GDO81_011516 [Engystomops pustulosus]